MFATLGAKVIVANPRKLAAIYQNERKSDRQDAETPTGIARMDPALLHPIQHGSEAAQQDMLRIKLRDALVRARVALINSVRFTLESLGHAVANPSSDRFHKVIMEELPDDICQLIAPNVGGNRGTDGAHQGGIGWGVTSTYAPETPPPSDH